MWIRRRNLLVVGLVSVLATTREAAVKAGTDAWDYVEWHQGWADHYSAMAADALYWDWHDDAEFWGGLSAAQSDWAQWYGTAPPEMPWNEPWAEWTVDEDSQAEPWAMWSSDPLFGDSPAFDDEPIDWQ